MLDEALRAPFRADDTAQTLVVGGALHAATALAPVAWAVAVVRTPLALLLAPLAVAPGFVLLGFDLRVFAAVVADDPFPSLVRWGGLVRDGVRALAVRLWYGLPTLVLGGATLALLVRRGPATRLVDLDPATAATIGAAGFGTAVAALGYAYLVPAGLAVCAVAGLRAALLSRRPLRVAAVTPYATAWLLGGALLVVGGAVALPLQAVLVGFVLLFYVRVAAVHLYGRGATAALGTFESDDAPPPRDEPSAYPSEAPVAVQTGRTVPRESGDEFAWVTSESLTGDDSTR